MPYDFKKIEDKWRKIWRDKEIFKVKENLKKEKYYVLEMFPYPSGEGLHIGHALNYTIGDIYARFKRLKGFNVLYPMGYDSLGLPAENAAIKAGIHPEKYTENSIKNFMNQQTHLGLSYDWSRMIDTSNSDYYKWDQWIFLKMLEKGIAYRKKASVNWCPKCKTVLANEQVKEGKCWRHKDTEIEIKHLEQWFFKITDYAEELLDRIDDLDWPEKIKIMQKHWIGKSSGTEILFDIETEGEKQKWPIFTTRPDTLFGVTFMVISAQHSRLMELVTDKQKKEVEDFLKRLKSVSEKTLYGKSEDKSSNSSKQSEDFSMKEGVFTGSYAINPLTKEKVPVYAGNFVVADYGSGMVMAVPAHDQRDFEFAEKYNIPLKIVIQPENYNIYKRGKEIPRAYTGEGVLIDSGEFTGMQNEKAKKEITKYLEKKELGKKVIQYKLRDWLVSRQRYWGTPIPVIYCDKCGIKNLDFINYKSYLMGASKITDNELIDLGIKIAETKAKDRKLLIPKEKIKDYVNLIKRKLDEGFWNEIVGNEIRFIFKFKGGAIKEFSLDEENQEKIAKLCAKFNNEPYEKTEDLLGYLLDNDFYKDYVNKIRNVKPAVVPVPEKDLPVELPKKVEFGKGNPLTTNEKWLKVKCPKCGGEARRETDTMDTFVNSSWYFLRYTDPQNSKEIFDKKKANYWTPVDLYIGGAEHATMHLIYFRFYTKFLRDLGLLDYDEPALKLFNQGMLHGEDGEKMSKSRGNVINPLDVIKKYGADSLRLALMSFASPDSDTQWDEKVLIGSFKFLNKVYEYFEKVKISKADERVESKLNKTIQETTKLITEFKYNLAIIKIRELFNSFKEENNREVLNKFLIMLHVFCPFITEELWEKLKNKGFISLSKWPEADESKINEKFEKQEQATEKIIKDIVNILNIIKTKGEKKDSIYVYVLPNELDLYDEAEISKKVGKKIRIFAVNDKNKYDPTNKSKNTKPGKPGIYLE